MNQRLKEAASCGDIGTLYSLIQKDACVLERLDQLPFVETPLHISAAAGQTHFAMEIMRLKPSFAKKLDPNGYSPLHLALQNQQTETIFRLLEVDKDLVSVQGREGLTPLHIAAAGGKADILAKFLVCCPKSIKELTVRKETALHVAVRNGDFEAFNVLLEWIQQACMATMLDWLDDEGNNIMHIAALKNQIQMVKLLIKKVNVTTKNKEGFTPLDIMKERGFLEDKELSDLLHHAHILKRSSCGLGIPTLSASFWTTLSFIKRLVVSDHREVLYMSKEDRNAVLVVSVLIATATYQSVLSPPIKNLQFSPASGNYINLTYFSIINICFTHFNTIAFLASMIEICLHLPSGIGYALHLVLPLVICYTLLMLFSLNYVSVAMCLCIVFFVLLLSKSPIVMQKINGDLKPNKLIKLHALFKSCPSPERELAEINMHLRCSGKT